MHYTVNYANQKILARKTPLPDEGLTLEPSAFETLYGGQSTLSTQLIKPNCLVTPPTDAAP